MRVVVTAMRVVAGKEGEGGMVMAMVTRMVGKQHPPATKRAVAMATRVAGKDEDDGKSSKVMAMATKREIARKRAMAIKVENKMTATETTMMTTTTMAMNTMMMTTTVTMMTKTTTKKEKTMAQRQWLVVADGCRGGQQKWRQRGLSVHIFLMKLVLGVVGCWQGAEEAGGKLSLKYPPRKVDVSRN